jgi:hypothetical protein
MNDNKDGTKTVSALEVRVNSPTQEDGSSGLWSVRKADHHLQMITDP